jgi:hypothetical protein
MATFEQERERLEKLRHTLGELNKIKPESLVRKDVLGKDLSFEAGLPVFQRTLELYKSLSECNLDGIPYETLGQLTSIADQALQYFQQIMMFSIQQHPSNPAQVRDQLINQLRDAWHGYFTHITPQIAYAIRRGSDFDSLEREARGTLALMKQLVNDIHTDKDKTLVEMQGALEKVRLAAAEAGVAQHAIHFKQEADSYGDQSKQWLVIASIFAGLTMLYGVFTGYFDAQLHKAAADAAQNIAPLIPLVLSRVIIFSVLSFAMIWSVRNYSASRHNFVINRHRQNALSTFEAFVKSASDAQTKDAVLVQTTQSIFLPQASGYAKSEGDSKPSSQIVEVVRSLTGAKS